MIIAASAALILTGAVSAKTYEEVGPFTKQECETVSHNVFVIISQNLVKETIESLKTESDILTEYKNMFIRYWTGLLHPKAKSFSPGEHGAGFLSVCMDAEGDPRKMFSNPEWAKLIKEVLSPGKPL